MERLPNELLLSIGKHSPQQTLQALTLCCRRFRDVFQPLIYSHISFASFSISSVRFIIWLWKHPKLASQVRRLDLCWTDCDQEPFDGFDEGDEAVGFIEDALSEIFTPEEGETKDLWEEHLNGENLCAEAWLGLLLVRMTCVEILEFGHENSHLMLDILRKAAKRDQPFNQGPPFPCLQEVRGCVQWGASWISSDFLLPFFYFPAVRKIYGSAISELSDEDSRPLDISQSSCPVQEIVIDEGYWCRGMLDWLAVCTKLEHISIRVEIQADEYELSQKWKFDASQFRRAILPHSTTLKTLCIRYGEFYRDYLNESDADDDAFGSFSEFTVLQHLTVRHAHLTGPPLHHSSMCWGWERRPLMEILPYSLKVLEITDVMGGDHTFLSEVSKLLEYRHIFKDLERLVVHLQEEDDEALGDALNALKLGCEAAGIFFQSEIQ
jgi:hypothetical protein